MYPKVPHTFCPLGLPEIVSRTRICHTLGTLRIAAYRRGGDKQPRTPRSARQIRNGTQIQRQKEKGKEKP